MQSIEIFQIDAFTDKVFHGNPAAVCLLHEWLNEELMQAIAVENNLSETAFLVQDDQGYGIRWFTPDGEINLCGHATLAAGFVLFERRKVSGSRVIFSSLSGPLSVSRKHDLYSLDFPKLSYAPDPNPELLMGLLDKPVAGCYVSDLDYLVLLHHENDVLTAKVDLRALVKLPKRGLIITSSAADADFYSRCFYPKHRIAEDPVTGSAHCVLAPFWTDRLNKKNLHAMQGSFRKGQLVCEVQEDRVVISGYCKWYMKGRLVI